MPDKDPVHLLTVSDKECLRVYSPNIKERFKHIDLAISCGDLSYHYVEYIQSSLNVPLYYVLGNHAKDIEFGTKTPRTAPWGAVNLHKKTIRDSKTDLLLAGIEGCLSYNEGKHQYTQAQMWAMVLQLIPGLIRNKLRFGRYLDVFVTHAPLWGIHDQEDRCHQGVRAFKWLVRTIQPAIHIHGHIHIYRPDTVRESKLGNTRIVNTYGFRTLSLERSPK